MNREIFNATLGDGTVIPSARLYHLPGDTAPCAYLYSPKEALHFFIHSSGLILAQHQRMDVMETLGFSLELLTEFEGQLSPWDINDPQMLAKAIPNKLHAYLDWVRNLGPRSECQTLDEWAANPKRDHKISQFDAPHTVLVQTDIGPMKSLVIGRPVRLHPKKKTSQTILALHNDNGAIMIDHLPSGMKIATFNSIRMAKTVADNLVRIFGTKLLIHDTNQLVEWLVSRKIVGYLREHRFADEPVMSIEEWEAKHEVPSGGKN